MTHSTDDNIPQPPAPETDGSASDATENKAEAKKFPWVWLLVGGLGCGCLGLLGFVALLIGAIALPSFLNQAQQAQESEGQMNVGALVRGQQAYHLETGAFTSNLNELGLGIAADGINYTYAIVPQADPSSSVYITATPNAADGMLRSYGAAVFAVGDEDAAFSVTGICQSNEPSPEPPPMPTLNADGETVDCPEGSSAP
ncbi:MAG: type IV pilin-like G/H family protein [Spirulinaceae cyanobacterium]